MNRHTSIALGIALALGIVNAAVAAETPPSPLQEATSRSAIPAMPLRQALDEFAEREHLKLVYVSALVSGVQTSGASGGLTQRATLQALLLGTGLEYQYLDANTVTISRATGREAADPPPGTPPQSAQLAKQPVNLQGIIVTGTRAFDRTVADSLAPVDVITPSDLRGTGAPDLPSALRTLLPSFNFPQPSGNDMLETTMPAQLRGLSPDQTLVLVNGKRQHTTAMVFTSGLSVVGRGSSPVDLGAIPMNAIERIEVLRDGAAAQYGSDAIAGVINIILKGGAGAHGAASIERGQYAHNQDGPGRWGGNGTTLRGGATTGFDLGRNGWMHVSANYVNQSPTNHATPDRRFPGDPTFGTVTGRSGLPYQISRQAAINSQYSLGENATLYAFGTYNARNVRGPGFFRSLSQYKKTTPAAVAVYPDGFLPVENSAIRDSATVLGLRGEALGWHYDFSGNTGSSHWKLYVDNTFNYALQAKSPVDFYIGTLAVRQNEFNADFSKDVEIGWHSPLTVAWGLTYRHEQFGIKEGDQASYFGSGAQAFPGYQPNDAGTHRRHSTAEYVDLETEFTEKFSAGLAARHEHYSDFGNNISWKLSGRYAFAPEIALRSTISTGFRAPSLQQEFYSSTTNNFVQTSGGTLVPVTVRTFPVSDPAAQALGAEALKPEKSRNYSVGLVWTPRVGPYVTLDLYQIDIDDEISLSGTLSGPAVQKYLASVGFPFVGGGRFFTNAADTRTHGLDLVAAWPVQLAHSHIRFTGGLNYNKTEVRKIRPNPPQLGLAGLTLPILDRSQIGRIEDIAPRTKASFATDWSVGNWNLRGQLTRYGEWRVLGTTPAGDQRFSSRVLLDASITYNWSRWHVSFGGNNIINTYPDRNNLANSTPGGQLPYPSSSPFGFNGAYWYVSGGYQW